MCNYLIVGDRHSIANLASVVGLAKRMNSQRQDAVKGEGVKRAPESEAYIVSGCIVGERVIPLIPALMCHFLLSSPVLLHPWPTLFLCLPFSLSSLLPPTVASLVFVHGFINFQQLEWQWVHYYGNQFINTSFADSLNCFMKCTLELEELCAYNLNSKMGTEWGGPRWEAAKYVMRPLHVAAGTGL